MASPVLLYATARIAAQAPAVRHFGLHSESSSHPRGFGESGGKAQVSDRLRRHAPARLATKLLHKKPPALISILDNQAISAAYVNNSWPEVPPGDETIKLEPRIVEGLGAIAADIGDGRNV